MTLPVSPLQSVPNRDLCPLVFLQLANFRSGPVFVGKSYTFTNTGRFVKTAVLDSSLSASSVSCDRLERERNARSVARMVRRFACSRVEIRDLSLARDGGERWQWTRFAADGEMIAGGFASSRIEAVCASVAGR